MSNTAFNSNYVSTGGSASPATQEFRLTLTSNTPVLTTAVTGATTLYLTPYKGNNIGLYSAGAWSVVSSAEVSLSLAALSSANTLYDIFAYKSGVTVVLEALAWTNSGAGTSARATALAYQDGILVKSGDATRRYIGTIRTVAAGQTEFSFGSTAAGGGQAKAFVWNYYNRVSYSATVTDSTDSWSYTGATWRSANNSTENRVSFVCGVVEDFVQASYMAYGNSTGAAAMLAVGLNSTTAYSGIAALIVVGSTLALTTQAKFENKSVVGFNFVQALESAQFSQTATFYGDAGSPATNQLTGLQFTFMM